jgi:hypothetical protein
MIGVCAALVAAVLLALLVAASVTPAAVEFVGLP